MRRREENNGEDKNGGLLRGGWRPVASGGINRCGRPTVGVGKQPEKNIVQVKKRRIEEREKIEYLSRGGQHVASLALSVRRRRWSRVRWVERGETTCSVERKGRIKERR